jgi:hypothetical protein
MRWWHNVLLCFTLFWVGFGMTFPIFTGKSELESENIATDRSECIVAENVFFHSKTLLLHSPITAETCDDAPDVFSLPTTDGDETVEEPYPDRSPIGQIGGGG